MEKREFYDFIIKMQSISKIGLTYSKDPYAIDNYNQINNLSREMLEKFEDVSFDRPNYFSKDIYPTPNISVRTVIFNDKGNVLFVKEAKDGLYSLPGGWCDLYDSPSEAAYNEVLQEAGVKVNITNLVGILDRMPFKDATGQPEYVLVFKGEIAGEFKEHTYETTDVAFFPIDKLPPLSKKVSNEEILRMIIAAKEGKVIFD